MPMPMPMPMPIPIPIPIPIDKFHRAALFHHGDHAAHVFFQIIRGVDRQGAVVHRAPSEITIRILRASGRLTVRRCAHSSALPSMFSFKSPTFVIKPRFARALPRRVGGFVDDVAQIVEPPRLLRPARSQPSFARLPALPHAGGKARNFDLDLVSSQGFGHECVNLVL